MQPLSGRAEALPQRGMHRRRRGPEGGNEAEPGIGPGSVRTVRETRMATGRGRGRGGEREERGLANYGTEVPAAGSGPGVPRPERPRLLLTDLPDVTVETLLLREDAREERALVGAGAAEEAGRSLRDGPRSLRDRASRRRPKVWTRFLIIFCTSCSVWADRATASSVLTVLS